MDINDAVRVAQRLCYPGEVSDTDLVDAESILEDVLQTLREESILRRHALDNGTPVRREGCSIGRGATDPL